MEDSGKRAWKSSELRGARLKKGGGGSGRVLGKQCRYKNGHEALERLIEPEHEEVCPRYILKYSTRGGSNIFQLVDKQKALIGAPRREGSHAKSWQSEWSVSREDFENSIAPAKARRHPGTKKTSGSLRKSGEGGVSPSRRRLREC